MLCIFQIYIYLLVVFSKSKYQRTHIYIYICNRLVLDICLYYIINIHTISCTQNFNFYEKSVIIILKYNEKFKSVLPFIAIS